MHSRQSVSSMIKKFIHNKEIRFGYLSMLGVFNFLDDEEYIKKRFKAVFGYKLNLQNPKTFNEKIQWLKLFDRNPKYTLLVDKNLVKHYSASVIGEEYIIPTLGVWNNFDEIDFEKMPDKFVLKCTHDSGGIVICTDKSQFDITKAKRKIEGRLRKNYYLVAREWPYKEVVPKIIAEEYIGNEYDLELKDYKIMCFNGKAKCSFVCSGRFAKEGLRVTFFDEEWNSMPFTRGYPKSEEEIEKPLNYQLMKELAEKLSKGMRFLRVDFYEVDGKVYLGELTLFPGSGFEKFEPYEWDQKLGEWIQL